MRILTFADTCDVSRHSRASWRKKRRELIVQI